MRASFFGFVISLFMVSTATAKDLGFRFQKGSCVNSAGEKGLNPAYIGQCGDLSNVTIARFNFDDSDLSGSIFNNSDLQGSTLRQANLTGVSFQSTNLSGVELENATLHNVSFVGAILINAHLAGADFKDVDMTMADLSGALLSYMKFPGGKFNNAIFAGAVMDHTILTGLNFTGADFNGANLQAAVLDKTILTGANLARADLTAATLANVSGDGAKFQGATLRKANLQDSTFTAANFKVAQLDGANLNHMKADKSDMRGAVLKDASIVGATFNGASYSKRTLLPFSDKNAKDLGMLFIATPTIMIWDQYVDRAEEGMHTRESMRKGVPDLDDSDIKTVTSLNVAEFTSKLTESTVLLVPEMEMGSDPAFAKLIASSVKDFVMNGGILIVLTNTTFLTDVGLITTQQGDCDSDGDRPVVLPKHPLAEGLGPNIALQNLTCANILPSADFDIVVGEQARAYVYAKTLGKGTIVQISYDWYLYNDDATKLLGNAIRLAN